VKLWRALSYWIVLIAATVPAQSPRQNKAGAATLPKTGKFFTVDRSTLPSGLQQIPLERLSSGALMLLNHNNNLVHPPAAWSQKAATATPPSAALPQATPAPGIALDLRVGSNLRLGDDPAGLPPNMRAQAEPDIARSQINPDFLVATFQEGRFTNGGAVDCGYSISTDGGLTWTRALIPNLTTAVGGNYLRATDPVAGVDLSGNVYINTEGAFEANFGNGDVLVSKSTDSGTTFGAPSVVYHPPNDGVFPDKPWMTINNFSGTPTAGRIVVTFTRFASSFSPIVSSYSDDGGVHWSSISYIHSSSTSAQGSQPIFLPNGHLVIIYWNFGNSSLYIVTSTDGGATFGSPHLITAVNGYSEPSIRSGSFLPSAVGDGTNGNLYLVYQAMVSGHPKIAFTKSTDGGSTWTSPIAISDNPSTSGVFNPAVNVSPDGQTVIVVFYDHRNNPGSNVLVDLYLAQSFDGGATWQPNIRLTSVSTDASLAPLTSSGYMLGDYQAVAEPTSVNVPAVPVWIDTRTGNPDPFIARVGVSSQVNFTSWEAARLSLGQIDDPILGGPAGDADLDGKPNLMEYALGTPPNQSDTVGASITQVGSTFTVTYPRLKAATDVTLHAFRSVDLSPNSWTTNGVTETLLSDDGTIQMLEASTPANFSSLFMRLQATQP
jgi:BNR repeat-like domain